MKLNWLTDLVPVEVSYVDKPAIDRRFIELKRVEKKEKPFLSNVGDMLKKKFGFVDTKIGRVLSKSNENSLLKAMDTIAKASKEIQNVLSKIRKKSKEEDMEEKEIKELIEKSIDEVIDKKLGAFEESFEAKLKQLLFEDEKKKEEKEIEVKPDDEKVETEEEKKEREEAEKKKEEEEKASGKKSLEGSLLTKVLEANKANFKEIKSRFDKIEKELNIKPESDKKEVNEEEIQKKKDDADFTGLLRIKDL